MPISSINTDYTGRTKDLHIMQGVNPLGIATVDPSFGKVTSYCTGIQKLVQRYAICFLTAVGSQKNFPTFGTEFLPSLTNNRVRYNVSDVTALFNFSHIDVLNIFRDYQSKTPNLPDDEQLSAASLENISVINNNIELTIKLKPVATPAVTFILPLPLQT